MCTFAHENELINLLGTTIPRLFEYVSEFYVKNTQEKHNINVLCASRNTLQQTDSRTSKSVPVPKKPVMYLDSPNLNEEFQEYVWELLKREEDFHVGRDNEGGNMQLMEIVIDLKAAGKVASDGAPSKGHDKWKGYASEERRWRALTGHGIDYKKVSLI